MDKETSGYVGIAPKVYLYVASSTRSKISNLRRIFELYQLEGSELGLEIQNDTDDKDDF